MKRTVLIVVLLLLTKAASAISPFFPEQNWRWKPWGAGVSFNHVFTGKNLEQTSGNIIGIECLASGVYIAFGSNFDRAVHEDQYGGGKVSKNHPIFIFSGGYNYMFYYDGRIRMGIMPVISYISIDDRLEDLYYGKTKVVDTTSSFHCGLGFTYSSKVTTILIKAAPNIFTIGLLFNF